MPGSRAIRPTACIAPTAPKGAGAVFTFGVKGGYDAGVKIVEQ